MAGEASVLRSTAQAATLSAPTERFSNSKRAGEEVKAIGVCDNAGGIAGTIHCALLDEDVAIRTNVVWIPLITDEAVGGFAACTIVYCY